MEKQLVDIIPSKDSTPIAVWRSGAGMPLLLVHGTTHDHRVWAPVVSALGSHYRVYAMDRRGRGRSGDAGGYAIEREWEDIAAVIDAIGDAVDVVAHSFGGLCALEAARLTEHVRRLVLYEPTMPLGEPRREATDRMQSLVNAKEPEQALLVFCQQVLRLPPTELAALRASSMWPMQVALAHTIPRELEALDAYTFDAAPRRAIAAPTLFLVGGESPSFRRTVAEKFLAAVRSGHIGVLPGQRHGAIQAAPDLLAREVMQFLGPHPSG